MERQITTIGDTVQIKGREDKSTFTVVGLDFEDSENPLVKLIDAKGRVSKWGPVSKVELVTPGVARETTDEEIDAGKLDEPKLPAYYPNARIPIPAIPPVQTATPRPRKRAAAAPAPKRTSNSDRFKVIAEGLYALSGADGQLHAYKVEVPTKGRWEGYRFVRRVNADGTTSRITDLNEALDLLDRIAQDPDRARRAYK